MRIVVSAFGGLTNLIAIAYAILRILDNAPRPRLTLAVATLACMPLTLLSQTSSPKSQSWDAPSGWLASS